MNQWKFGWLIGVDIMNEKKKVIPMSYKSDRTDIEYVNIIDGTKSAKLGGDKCEKDKNPKYDCGLCDRIVC